MKRTLSHIALCIGLLCAASLTSLSARANEDGLAPAPSTAQYIYMEPAFVVNYGSTGRMRYLRTEVVLKVSSADAASRVTLHRPYLRNNLIMMFSAQEDEVMKTSLGRETLRKVALDEVRAVMMQLEGIPYIDDLYFSNFVVQN